ncbi:MAG: Ig-like domain-containing protein, partial [Gemmatimonadaceae bacterium]
TLTAIGATFTLAAVAKDASSNVVTGSFTWTSRTPAVATVSTTGVVTTVANGSSWIVATEAGGTKDSALFVVQQRLASISVTPNPVSIYLGAASPAFSASAVDGLGVPLSAQPTFTWATASSAIASITTGGVATGGGLGSTQVQATAGSVTGVATLNVVTRIKYIFVARDSLGFAQTRSDTFTVTALGNSRSYKAFAYD